ncbi:hypothetical protein [Corallococcus sp. EGB]|uniref:hypothetical protein n=1 Tax=Corallococcus sp. EGB TaxID=1521117 RepID=UPI001CC0EA7C|nr:hypothetical protein [Corallococcus sp. EGB]
MWVISDSTQHLTPEHVKVIKEFFAAGHGVYIWGDNEPYSADANVERFGDTVVCADLRTPRPRRPRRSRDGVSLPRKPLQNPRDTLE